MRSGSTRHRKNQKQECIPVGCVLHTAVAVTGGSPHTPPRANPPRADPLEQTPWRRPPEAGLPPEQAPPGAGTLLAR